MEYGLPNPERTAVTERSDLLSAEITSDLADELVMFVYDSKPEK